MCRLFGVSYGDRRESVPTSVIAATLFNSLTHGGKHAYGWFVSDASEVWYQKHHGRADTETAFQTVMDYDKGADVPIEEEVAFFVGHTRYATTGSPEHMANNHPILHGKILGVHNGKVYNHAGIIEKTGREDETSEVDSEAIFAAVNRWGPVKGLDRLVTDMVAVYVDLSRPERFSIARSANRSVVIGTTTKGNLIFASEQSALEALYPLVRFEKFEDMRRNRLFVIEEGRIISRRKLAVRSSEPAPPAVAVDPAEAWKDYAWSTIDDVVIDRLMDLPNGT